MEQKEFIELVAQMRMYQRDYFRTRDVNSLNQSKRLEREVDVAIAQYQNPNKQTTLF